VKLHRELNEKGIIIRYRTDGWTPSEIEIAQHFESPDSGSNPGRKAIADAKRDSWFDPMLFLLENVTLG